MNKNLNWTTENILDQTGKVAIITGSSSGIGYETAKVLASKNAIIIIAVRNLDKGKNAESKIRKQFHSVDIKVMKLDLADLESVKIFVDAFKSKYSQLNLLIEVFE